MKCYYFRQGPMKQKFWSIIQGETPKYRKSRMNPEHVKHLQCPSCQSELEIESSSKVDGRVKSGSIKCIACGNQYIIKNFIPRFVPLENYASSFGLQWNIHYKTQYDSYTGLPISETRFFESTAWEKNLKGQFMLEAGSGSGRFTEQAIKTGAFVVSFDYSDAVEANYKQNGHAPNLLIVQANIFQPPLKVESFDKLFCFGVLQHTPNPRSFFQALLPFVKPAGDIVIDVYKRNRLGKIFSFTPAPPSKYWLRWWTTRIKPERLYRWINFYIKIMWPICRIIGKIPKIGRNLNWMLLVADHSDRGLDKKITQQWAVLNTFDMLAPKYDIPQTLPEVRRWFESSIFELSDVRYGYNGIVAKGRIMNRKTADLDSDDAINSLPEQTIEKVANDNR